MKVTFVIYNIYGIGGTVRTVANTANYLAENGYDVEIISCRRSSQNTTFKLNSSIKLTPLYDVRAGKRINPNAPLYRQVIKRTLVKMPSKLIHKDDDLYQNYSRQIDIKLKSKIKGVKSGVLITTTPAFNILATKYAKKGVIKIGQEHKEFSAHSLDLQNAIKKHYGQLDVITCLTEKTKKEYDGILKGETEVTIMPNATEIFEEKSELNEKVVIAIGRLSPEKGYDRLIDIFAKLPEEYGDWKLKIFGDGPERGYLEQKIQQYNLYNNAYLMGNTSGVITELKKSSILLVTSHHEGFGMGIIEAMSVGVPTISFECGGPSEIISDGIDGFLVDQGNEEAFVEKLKLLMSDDDLRMKMQENISESAECYSLDNIGKRWERILGR